MMDIFEIPSIIVSELKNSCNYLTVSDLYKLDSLRCYKKKDIKNSLKKLVQKNDISYEYHLGHTFVELSINKLIAISKRIFITPSKISLPDTDTAICIKQDRGYAFGSGSHATTHLCLKHMDLIFEQHNKNEYKKWCCADVGTGSGILAIAAGLFDVKKIDACDTDAVALYEAKKNIRLNAIEEKVCLTTAFEPKKNHYHLILANLRYPTLCDLYPLFNNSLKNKGMIILSGFKPHEQHHVEKTYKTSFKKQNELIEKKWASLVFQKYIGK